MQSILTKYMPATNTKPSRIKAWTSGGAKTIVRSYQHELSTDDEHMRVAQELAGIMGWSGEFIEGSLGDKQGGNVYVINSGRGFKL